jgi:hypothetical protein
LHRAFRDGRVVRPRSDRPTSGHCSTFWCINEEVAMRMKSPEHPEPPRPDDPPGYADRDDDDTTEQTGGGVEPDDDRWATEAGDSSD